MDTFDVVAKLQELFTKEEITKDYYSPSEVAARVGRDKQTVQNWCRWGQIEAVKRGRRWYISNRELKRLIDSGCELKEPILENIPPSLRVRYA